MARRRPKQETEPQASGTGVGLTEEQRAWRRQNEAEVMGLTDAELEQFPEKAIPWVESLRIHKHLSDEIYFLAAHDPGARKRFTVPSTLDQVRRRMFVRSVFAYVEGMAYAQKWIGYGLNEDAFDTDERLLIAEANYRLRDGGKVEKGNDRTATAEAVRFSFAVLYKGLGKDWDKEPFRNHEGWKDLDEAIVLRNRLANPRKSSALVVSDDELSLVAKVFDWYGRHIAELTYPAMGRALTQAIAWGLAHAEGGPDAEMFLEATEAIQPFIDWLEDPSKGPPF